MKVSEKGYGKQEKCWKGIAVRQRNKEDGHKRKSSKISVLKV
jgi:hypothetical protein